MSTYAPSPSAYRSNAVLTASHGELIVMLYDGARRFLHQASVAMADGDIPAAHNKLSRAEEIVRHLRTTLDLEQGQLPDRLYSLYTFWLGHLRQARLDQDPGKVAQVSDMIGRLRQSWAAVAGEAQ